MKKKSALPAASIATLASTAFAARRLAVEAASVTRPAASPEERFIPLGVTRQGGRFLP